MAFRSFNLRGTSGSGKTTVAREIMDMVGARPHKREGRKVLVYQGLMSQVPIFILGSYETTCGGCDTIPKVQIVADLLQEFYDTETHCVVFFEGLMLSHMLGTVGAKQMALGAERNVLAFLDTPLSVCADRVMQRRKARGIVEGALPEKTFANLTKDHASVERCKGKAVMAGHRVIVVSHTQAIYESRAILRTLIKEANGGK